MNRNIKTAVSAMLILALASAMVTGLSGCGSAPAAASADASTVTVSASGTIRIVPDKATVYFGVTTQEQTAEAAQSKNTEAVNKVIALLTERGVEEKSIRTTNYSMYPQYDYSEMGEQRIIGYVVYTNMSVQDQNIEDLGKLLSACVAAGINTVDNVSFLCSGYDEAYSQALSQAVEASRDKAAVLAAAAGKTLGEAVTITEGWQDTSARYGKAVNLTASYGMEAAYDTGAAIQPGESEITANVTVTYIMK